jgi:hypothetical protein
MNWNSVVIIICVLLAALAIWKEYIRANKVRVTLRIISALLAVFALACIALPITYHTDLPQQNKHEVVLLTEGTNPDSISRYNSNRLFTLDRLIKKQKPQATLLNTIDELTADSTITQLHILGDGLNEEQLQQLNHLPVVFHPQGIREGITAIGWNEKLKTGDELNIQGRFKNTSVKKVKLLLKGLSTPLDSAIIAPQGITSFHLSVIPKNSGKTVYSLLAIVGADTIAKESLPIQIEPAKPLRVLMLTASPDFESRFLKNWLSENGYAVAIRSTISKDKFNKEFINMEQLSFDHLSAVVLNKFDILIGDLSVLKSFNGAEASVLKLEVTQKGLGIIVRADSTLRSDSWLQSSFPLDKLAGKDTTTTALQIQGSDKKLAKLNSGAVYINYQNATQSLVNDEHGHTLVSSTLVGAGRLVYTPLNNTFSLMLGGNKDDYNALWSLLISKAARKAQAGEAITIKTAVPSVSNPVGLQMQSALAQPLIFDQFVVSSQQDPLLLFNHYATYWPQNSGWQSVKQNNSLVSWYVYPDDAWKGLRALKKQEDTRNYIAKNAIVHNVTKQIHEKAVIAVAKIYFYVLLLLACIFLWVEAKIS